MFEENIEMQNYYYVDFLLFLWEYSDGNDGSEADVKEYLRKIKNVIKNIVRRYSIKRVN